MNTGIKYAIFLMVAVTVLSSTSVVLADTITLPNPLCPTPGPNCIDSLPKLIAKVSEYISAVVAGLATIMLVYAGILYVTSGGDPGKAGKAKQAVIYAIIGLAIALAGKGLAEVIQSVVTSGA